MIEQGEAAEERKRLERRKLDQLLGYCESMQCRRQVLLAGFGETYPQPCGNCDNCLTPAATWDATEAARKALSCVYRTGQRFGAAHLIDVLRGADTERIRQLGHDQLTTYGIGSDLDAATWRGVFRQLVAASVLEVDAEGHGSLRLTASAKPVLQGQQTLLLRKDSPKLRQRSGGTSPAAAEVPETDQPLFQALRRLRAQLAKEQNVPAYVIFHDATLRNIAQQRPTDLRALARVGGVGGSKLDRYGPALIDVVREAG
jgi:ATP-dependent DNA helicase RecQ